jgi:hypothetical protein
VISLPSFWPDRITSERNFVSFDDLSFPQKLQRALLLEDDHMIRLRVRTGSRMQRNGEHHTYCCNRKNLGAHGWIIGDGALLAVLGWCHGPL